MSAEDADRRPVCSRCGSPQPPAGSQTASDGSPIRTTEYLALAGLVGQALVCPACVTADTNGRVEPGAQAAAADGAGAAEERPPAADPARHPPPELPPRRGARPRPRHCETVLEEQECRNLLATRPVGRIAFTERALPVIYPAHFVISKGEIVLAALPDGRVSNAERHAVVAFEVDAYDPATQQGWFVSVVGPSRLITDSARVQELDALHFSPWANSPDRHYIAVQIGVVRGKKLTRSP